MVQAFFICFRRMHYPGGMTSALGSLKYQFTKKKCHFALKNCQFTQIDLEIRFCHAKLISVIGKID